jgi:hypothetical protein
VSILGLIKFNVQGCLMKNALVKLIFSAQHINSRNIQLVFTLVALALLVLGVGAPAGDGGPK